ncbi:MAG: peptidase S41 [Clostridiales bacterium]|nr:MAG: peptidase S41 [Clostridiales bacterium]
MKKVLKTLLCLILCFCVTFTGVVGTWGLLHKDEVFKFAYIANLIKSNFLFEYQTDDLIEGAITGMVEALDDPYSVYMDKDTTEQMYESNAGVFGGIGIYATLNDDGRVIVSSPIKDGPSEKAGIEAEDIIYAVDDQSTEGMDLDTVVAMMRGEVGTEVKITVKRGDELQDFTITRAYVDEQTVSSQVLAADKRIGYIAISKFSENTDEAFTDQLNELIDQGIQSLIIDLRYNGGGSVDAACNIAALMVPEGPIVQIVDNKGSSDIIKSPGAQFKAPIAVLVNEYSASASEILAGALQDTKAANLIGTTTYGKGIVQTVYFLNDGTGVKLTEKKYLTPNGNDINKKGIEPNVYVEIKGDKDTQLDFAVEYLKSQMHN